MLAFVAALVAKRKSRVSSAWNRLRFGAQGTNLSAKRARPVLSARRQTGEASAQRVGSSPGREGEGAWANLGRMPDETEKNGPQLFDR